MKPAIVIGNMTDHGGVVTTGDSAYLIDGKAAHVEGMTHFVLNVKLLSQLSQVALLWLLMVEP